MDPAIIPPGECASPLPFPLQVPVQVKNENDHLNSGEDAVNSLEFSVEKIVNSILTEDGCRYYQVKWFDTWIEESSLAEKCEHLIEIYWNSKQGDGDSTKPNELGGSSGGINSETSNSEPEKIRTNSQMKNGDSYHYETQGERENESAIISKDEKMESIKEVVIDQSTLSNNNPDNVCEVCGKILSSKKVLKRHVILLHLKNGRQECSICHKRFFSTHDLKRHMPVHTNVRKYPCKFCDKLFKQSGQAYKHMLTHGGKKRYECDVCHRKFLFQDGLLTHFATHSVEKAFKCSKCDVKFKHKQSVYKHIKNCHGERGSICSACDAGFQNFSQLKKHIRDAHSVGLFSCLRCPRTFMTKKFLELHVLKHENGGIDMPPVEKINKKEKPERKRLNTSTLPEEDYYSGETKTVTEDDYSCKKCCKVFKRKHALQNHLKLNQCCNESQNSEDKNSHIADESDPVACKICSKTYLSEEELTFHLSIDHNIPENQTVTNNATKTEEEFLRPESTSLISAVSTQFKCEKCEAIFTRKDSFAKHKQVHSNKRFVCTICDKTFKWYNSLSRHQQLQHSVPTTSGELNENDHAPTTMTTAGNTLNEYQVVVTNPKCYDDRLTYTHTMVIQNGDESAVGEDVKIKKYTEPSNKKNYQNDLKADIQANSNNILSNVKLTEESHSVKVNSKQQGTQVSSKPTYNLKRSDLSSCDTHLVAAPKHYIKRKSNNKFDLDYPLESTKSSMKYKHNIRVEITQSDQKNVISIANESSLHNSLQHTPLVSTSAFVDPSTLSSHFKSLKSNVTKSTPTRPSEEASKKTKKILSHPDLGINSAMNSVSSETKCTIKSRKRKTFSSDLLLDQQIFKCDTCNTSYPSHIDLLKHLLNTHKNELQQVKKDSTFKP